MNDFSQDYEAPVVEPPKKRRGWPKGQKRGPRKAKGAVDPSELIKARVRLDHKLAAPKVPKSSNGAAPKTLTQLMFNVDRATALVLEDMVAAIQGLPEDCRRDLIAALQRVFDEH
jgi:hypothetical protein